MIKPLTPENMSATIQIGWRDSLCPMDSPITPAQLIHSNALARARKHLAIERGSKHAWASAWKLARHIKRISAALPEGYLQIHTTNQTGAPKPWDSFLGLGVEIRYVVGNAIQWDISLFASDNGSIIHQYVWGIAESEGVERHTTRTATRVDQLLRQIDRVARPAFSAYCERMARAL